MDGQYYNSSVLGNAGTQAPTPTKPRTMLVLDKLAELHSQLQEAVASLDERVTVLTGRSPPNEPSAGTDAKVAEAGSPFDQMDYGLMEIGRRVIRLQTLIYALRVL